MHLVQDTTTEPTDTAEAAAAGTTAGPTRRTPPVGPLHPGRSLLRTWRLMCWAWRQGTSGRMLARALRVHIRRSYACDLSPASQIGADVFLPHPIGLVVGDGVVIGDGVTLYQHVTLGRDGLDDEGYPRIEPGVTIYACAVVVGDITIGRDATVAAHAVVRRNIAPGTVAVGIPARQIDPSLLGKPGRSDR